MPAEKTNYTKMLHAVLNKSWKQHSQESCGLASYLIIQTIQVRWTTHAGHHWRSKEKLKSDILWWIPTHGLTGVGWPAKTYNHQFCADTGCCSEDLPRAMADDERQSRKSVISVHFDDDDENVEMYNQWITKIYCHWGLSNHWKRSNLEKRGMARIG